MFKVFAYDKITKIGSIDFITMQNKSEDIQLSANEFMFYEKYIPLVMMGKSFNIQGQNKPINIYLEDNLWIANCWLMPNGNASKYGNKIYYRKQNIKAEKFTFCKKQKYHYDTFCVYDNNTLNSIKSKEYFPMFKIFNEPINNFLIDNNFDLLKNKIEKLSNLKVFW